MSLAPAPPAARTKPLGRQATRFRPPAADRAAALLAARPAPSPFDFRPASFWRRHLTLLRLAVRGLRQLSLRTMWNAAYLYAYKGMLAVWAYKRRLKRGELFPPFMFVALTNACNLRCQGCWVEKDKDGEYLPADDLAAMIEGGKKRQAHYYTLLGGEPFLHRGIWDVFRRHKDCYFQVITNGMFFTDKNVARLKQVGNVTPLISIDGPELHNDMRRGEGVYAAAVKGMEKLKQAGLLFGVATTVTGRNMAETMTDEYAQRWVDAGAMYLWYYIYRPVGAQPHPEYCMKREQITEMRRRLLCLRQRRPIFLIDTYWTATGEAFCPAAMGLGFHVGPSGGIEICPPLSFAAERIQDNGGDIHKTINESTFLRGFQDFVKTRTKGCVILEHPQTLVDYIRGAGAADTSGRDAFSEIAAGTPRHSHHLAGEEIPEDFWFYRVLKSQVFFGMGALG